MKKQKFPTLESMFNRSHFKKNMSFLERLILVFYLPIGCGLICFRFFLFLVMGTILIVLPPFYFPLWLGRLIMLFFGIVVRNRKEPTQKFLNSKTVIVSNHRTAFDVFPFVAVTHLSVLIDKGFFETNFIAKQFQKVCGAIPIDKGPNEESRQLLKESILKHVKESEKHLLVFPEGWDSNGKEGIMLFQKFLFSIGLEIQPVSLRASVPLLPLEPGVLGSSILREVLFLFFVPCIFFELSFLEISKIKNSETAEEFAARNQRAIAFDLGLSATPYTVKDALELRKTFLKNEPKKKE